MREASAEPRPGYLSQTAEGVKKDIKISLYDLADSGGLFHSVIHDRFRVIEAEPATSKGRYSEVRRVCRADGKAGPSRSPSSAGGPADLSKTTATSPYRLIGKASAALAASDAIGNDPSPLPSAEVLDLDGVAERRERFVVQAAASSQVAVYEFLIPEGATSPAIGAAGQDRSASDQLQLAVAVIGGAVGKFWGGLGVRVPAAKAERFEALAKPLIEAFLVAYRR